MTLTRPSAEDWHTRAENDFAFAKAKAIASGSLSPMYIVYGEDQTFAVLTAMAKDLARKMIAMICVAHAAYGLTYMDEIWFADDAITDAGGNIIPPSGRTDRREGICIATCYRTDDTDERINRILIGDIIRNNDGKIIDIIRQPDLSGSANILTGPMTEVLPDETPSPQLRAKARAILGDIVASGVVHCVPLSQRPMGHA
jgi:hypothetical protein